MLEGILMLREKAHSTLVTLLSDALKDRVGDTSMPTDDLWSSVLDHVFLLLTLTRP